MLPTTSLPAVFTFSFLVAIGAVISPGPVSTTIVSQTPSRGWLTGPLVATGHILLELVLVALIVLGLGAGLANPFAQIAIGLSGGLLLLWMGGTMIRDTLRGRIHLPSQDSVESQMSRRQLVGLGMLATISNPFWYAWWVTVAAGYLAQAYAISLAMVLAFYLGHITADYAWDTALSTVIGRGRRWMTDTFYKALILICGAFFIYLAIGFIVQGITLLSADIT